MEVNKTFCVTAKSSNTRCVA